jgi:predicted RNase H-like HicB family nuclease
MNSFELTAVYEPCDEGGFIAYSEEIPGINSQGASIEEAKENIADAINLMFAEIRASQTNKDIKENLCRKICKDLETPDILKNK